ncbi:60S ribosomal protein L12, putative [Entamoeba dispar SAW760]|uniref:60S ribosomal protein L12, putative n=1 Tax=Entamoeba dispar (strain ATCC PRA-260 / SAW760) TaxID=370354 RepID=B0E772_ENTDS|nr:60S ribosomal protein L12, putative [Entamoeba dispar SAW760]EDR29622.1 60S ribosomal protein L12, putative [Entamoeba dispar SAW760]|eukprot:EDR29622.1 60S ribosomal protein L12, putative [Entamoeba dispar SAW760]
MPPKPNPNEKKELVVKVVAGDAAAGASLGPKVGPLGLNPKKTGDDLAKSTLAWKGLRVTVKITVVNRVATYEVIPSAAALILKALKEPPKDRKKNKGVPTVHSGSISMDDVYEIARTMRPRSLAKTFSGTVKEILGTCNSCGCQVDKKSPKQVIAEINNGEIEVPEN